MTPNRANTWRALGVILAGAAVVLAEPPPPPQPSTQTPARDRAADPDLEEAILVLKSGRIVQGLVTRRDATEVVIRIEGIDTRFPVRSIDSMQVLPPVRERYRQMQAALEPTDVEGHLALAEWLRARELYTEALDELRPVLELEPFNTRARELRRWLEAQITLESRTARPSTRSPSGERPRPAPGKPDPAADDADRPDAGFPVLTEDQINLIRVYELNLDDPPKMRVDRSTVEDLLRAYADNDLVPATQAGRDRLLSADASEIVQLMFKLQAREFYGRIRVLEDPRSIRLFKDRIQGTGGWLMNACATSRCHGGPYAGRLYLQNRRPNSDATAYTNFLILDRHKLEDGTPLIDYQHPEKSPLLQMGLPRDQSLNPHPDVPGHGGLGWRPIFRSTEDRQFQKAVEWVGSMYQPRIGYPITYDPPSPPEIEDPKDEGRAPASAPPGPGTPSDDPTEG
ncbi:MAG: hypothetical protein R3B49_07330 [Phycisphaerales bacterium]